MKNVFHFDTAEQNEFGMSDINGCGYIILLQTMFSLFIV